MPPAGALWRLLCPALLLALGPPACRAVDVIAASRLETCVFDVTLSAAGGQQLSCAQKLVMALSVDSGDAVATSSLELTLGCIGSPTGACPCPCDYASDLGCQCRDLTSPLRVNITKSPLWASYPLQYLQPFNWKPTEGVVRPKDAVCLDGEYEEDPSCGWYYLAGVKQPDSQGFKCECTASQIWDETFGTNKERTRGNLDCDFFSNLWQIAIGRNPCSAHCLVYDSVWAGSYSLGAATLHFEIGVGISASLAGAGGAVQVTSETIEVSPVTPIATSEGRVLLVKLLGDLAGYSQLPVLSDKVLMVPATPHDLASAERWMLVGTGFPAFRNQPNGCARAPNTCLRGQLADLYEEDLARIRAGVTPLYSVRQFSYGTGSSLARAPGSGDIALALPVSSRRSSLITIEVAADSMRFVTNAAPGRITGTVAASFTLSLSNCSVGVAPVEALRLALEPNATVDVTPFQARGCCVPRVYVQDAAANADRYCWLMLYDSVPFYTNATEWGEIPTGGLNGTGDGYGARRTPAECVRVCGGGIHNLRCLWRNKCWGRIGGFVGLFAGLAATAAVLILLAKLGALMPMLSFCFGWLSCFRRRGGGRRGRGRSRGGRRASVPLEDEAADGGDDYAGSGSEGGGGSGKGGTRGGGKGGRRYSPSLVDDSADGAPPPRTSAARPPQQQQGRASLIRPPSGAGGGMLRPPGASGSGVWGSGAGGSGRPSEAGRGDPQQQPRATSSLAGGRGRFSEVHGGSTSGSGGGGGNGWRLAAGPSAAHQPASDGGRLRSGDWGSGEGRASVSYGGGQGAEPRLRPPPPAVLMQRQERGGSPSRGPRQQVFGNPAFDEGGAGGGEAGGGWRRGAVASAPGGRAPYEERQRGGGGGGRAPAGDWGSSAGQGRGDGGSSRAAPMLGRRSSSFGGDGGGGGARWPPAAAVPLAHASSGRQQQPGGPSSQPQRDRGPGFRSAPGGRAGGRSGSDEERPRGGSGGRPPSQAQARRSRSGRPPEGGRSGGAGGGGSVNPLYDLED
ncbi:hypothetical protein Rsub_08306 [Raphidocelis subcapitata]|uniref:Generative cell specific-1/HAP2 domain-containing protein n=1 Tax=Raphidocelis subcapitata TaxID=307507 RepID=A0A2V0PDV6_9CHLO|nr:hypothetical protein Rsub_08306 [Raphidocelis subcapitata]|eukprot:GBF95275.1 hypothetical protein Rsub_08306 [Raphidocelis subcapitata]